MKLLDSEILHLDNHVLVVDKAPLLLTVPTLEVQDSVQERGKEWLKEHFQKPGNVFLTPAHRLDRVASGIVVCARTSKAIVRLNEQIQTSAWVKRYKLRYEGSLPAESGTLTHYLKKGEFRTYVGEQEGAKEAILNYTMLEPGVAEVELITGRYHQIRAQFAAIGCPIAGDRKYGATGWAISKGIDLHHMHVEFDHPTTGQRMIIDCPPPF